jgi:3-oxoacyl-[acyl-carrier protein] reductase
MSTESGSITGHTVIVVGAGSGIGRAAAKHFVSAGANVICADRDEEGIRETVATAPDCMSAWRTDVTDRDDVDALM